MEYRLVEDPLKGNDNLGWRLKEEKGQIVLEKGGERIGIEFRKNKLRAIVKGEGKVVVVRDGNRAFLLDQSQGEIRAGDEVWLVAEITIKIVFFEKEKIKKDIFVAERRWFDERGSKELNLILGLGVLTILIGIIVFGYQKRSGTIEQNNFENMRAEFNQKLNEAKAEKEKDPDKSLEMAGEAEEILNKNKFKKVELINQVEKMKTEVVGYQNKLGRENKNYEVAYDTKLIYEGERQFTGLNSKDSLIYLWSKPRAEIVAVNLEMKSKDKIVDDEKIQKISEVFNNGEKWHGYGDNKLWEIKRNALEETTGDLAALNSFNAWKGLIYALNNEQKQIVKLSGNGTANWLSVDSPLPEKMVSVAIDGDIWTLSESGKIYKFSRGVKVDWEMEFLPKSVSPKKIITSDKVNFLAFINDDKVWIYGKNGKILARLNFGKEEIIDIAMENPKEAILVLAADGNIYRVKNNEIF